MMRTLRAMLWTGRDALRTCAYLPWAAGLATLAATGAGPLAFAVFALASLTVWAVREA